MAGFSGTGAGPVSVRLQKPERGRGLRNRSGAGFCEASVAGALPASTSDGSELPHLPVVSRDPLLPLFSSFSSFLPSSTPVTMPPNFEKFIVELLLHRQS